MIFHYEFRFVIIDIVLVNYSLLWKWTLAIFLTISSPFIFWITILAIPIFIIVKSLWHFLLPRMIPMIIIRFIHFLRCKIFNSPSFISHRHFKKSFFLENSLLLIILWICVENFCLVILHVNFRGKWSFWISILMTEIHSFSSRIIVRLRFWPRYKKFFTLLARSLFTLQLSYTTLGFIRWKIMTFIRLSLKRNSGTKSKWIFPALTFDTNRWSEFSRFFSSFFYQRSFISTFIDFF